MKIVLGTRGSELAMWQAGHISDKLNEFGHMVEVKVVVTMGDRVQDLGFDKMEGKGFFTKEIEEALLSREIDLAVHSLKDIGTEMPQGLSLAAVSKRENPADVMLVASRTAIRSESLLKLAPGSVVGTSSARRKSQLLALRSDLRIRDLRGNVPTRIRKLRDGDYDAIILAQAGLNRIQPDLSDLLIVPLEPQEFIPAPGQGALGIQIRSSDDELRQVVRQLNDEFTEKEVALERELLRNLEGGCQLPLGIYCRFLDGIYHAICAWSPSKDIGARIFKTEHSSADKVIETLLNNIRNE